jgi:S-adenosylmethionine:tRNA ribosyltransferase-isomerase
VDLQRTDAYEYTLPPDRIARYPADRRDASRLLAMERGTATFRNLRFTDLPSLLRRGDLIVVNESRVLPARLLGRKPTGAECEVLLLRPADPEADPGTAERWEALVRPGSKLKPGRRVLISPELEVVVERGLPGGSRIVRLECPGTVRDAIEQSGHVPLPPYLEREEEPLDRERYQTVYARVPGSVAAPTAGLHFTPRLLERITERGVRLVEVTLHVGPGTFRPVAAEALPEHRMHRERWQVGPEAAEAFREARSAGGRVWAVGTTVVRTLESALGGDGVLRQGRGETDLFIFPGYRFRAVDGLVTNFHLPRSTLLMLVAAFGGYSATLAAYAHAVEAGYRFYSYGDAMVVTPRSGGAE